MLHDDEGRIAGFSGFINMSDIGMIQRRSGSGLAKETPVAFRVRQRAGTKDFDSDRTEKLRIEGAVDDPHSAFA